MQIQHIAETVSLSDMFIKEEKCNQHASTFAISSNSVPLKTCIYHSQTNTSQWYRPVLLRGVLFRTTNIQKFTTDVTNSQPLKNNRNTTLNILTSQFSRL